MSNGSAGQAVQTEPLWSFEMKFPIKKKGGTGPVRIEMPYEAEWIIDNIRSHGYEAFIVGGCVRDAVLGRIPGTGISQPLQSRSR